MYIYMKFVGGRKYVGQVFSLFFFQTKVVLSMLNISKTFRKYCQIHPIDLIELSLFSHGSVRATLRLVFTPSQNQVIEKLEVAVKRGKIETINVDPSNFQMNEMGKFPDV